MLGKLSFKYLRDRPNFLKIIFNTGWLFADKIIRMGAGVFVGIWIARYLGPQQFGLFNYAISFSALFSVLGTLSMDAIIVRELVTNPDKENTILGTSFFLRLTGGLIALFASVITMYFVNPKDSLAILLVGISSVGFIFQSFYIIDFSFQAELKSKYSFYAQNLAFILTAILKVILLVSKASLLYFAIVTCLEFLLAGFLFILMYYKRGKGILRWQFCAKTARKLLFESYPLIIAGVAIMIYMRIDQVMLGQMLNNSAVGIYSAAIKISEVWYFIPMAIASSIFPSIIKVKQESEVLYRKRMQQLYDLMSLIGITVALITTFVAPFVIHLLYGSAYDGAAGILVITIWTGVMVCISTIHSRWLILENLQKYNLVYAISGALSNFLINIFFIKKMGVIGAAYGTLFAQFVPFIIALFIKEVRQNIIMMLKALVVPFRFLFTFLK